MSFDIRRALTGIVLSNASSQLLIVLAVPVLTRLYTQSEFGEFGLFTVQALLLSHLLSAKLEFSVHEPDTDADQILNATLRIIALTGLVGATLFLILGNTQWAYINQLPLWAILVQAVGLALTNATMLHRNYSGAHRHIALLNLTPAIIFVSLAMLFGVTGIAENGLIIAQYIGFVGTGLLGVFLSRETFRSMKFSEIRAVLITNRANSLFLIPSSLMSVFSLNFLIVGFSALYGAQTAGLIVVCQRLVRAPVMLITKPLADVLRSSFTAPDQTRNVFNKILAFSTLLAMGSVIFVATLPEVVFGFILGNEWSDVKPIMIVLVVAAGAQMIGSWVNPVYVCYRKRHELYFQGSLVTVSAIAFLVAMALDLSRMSYLRTHTASVVLIYLFSILAAKRILTQISYPPTSSP